MKICSRCGKEHSCKFDTCDKCRSYNNANKMIYGLADMWGVDPDVAREGLQRALVAKEK